MLFAWQRLAASSVCVAVRFGRVAMYGGYEQRQAEERRKGEAARQQVMTALRITSHALDHMNKQLAAHHRANQD